MTIRAKVSGLRVIHITGLERGDGITEAMLQTWMRDEQRRLADMYREKQRTVRGPLGRISARWRARKVRGGFSPLRGQFTGLVLTLLLSMILWRVRIDWGGGQAWLSFRESPIVSRAPYYKYYRALKTAMAQGVLIMTAKFATELQRRLRVVQENARAAEVDAALDDVDVEDVRDRLARDVIEQERVAQQVVTQTGITIDRAPGEWTIDAMQRLIRSVPVSETATIASTTSYKLVVVQGAPVVQTIRGRTLIEGAPLPWLLFALLALEAQRRRERDAA